MCRSIKVLRTPTETADRPGVEAASLQFVRKVSGMRKPSKANQAAFDAAVLEITDVTQRLLGNLTKPAPPRRPSILAVSNADPCGEQTGDEHASGQEPQPGLITAGSRF
jgi:hypothetical protein